jgi:hypothetical protein
MRSIPSPGALPNRSKPFIHAITKNGTIAPTKIQANSPMSVASTNATTARKKELRTVMQLLFFVPYWRSAGTPIVKTLQHPLRVPIMHIDLILCRIGESSSH